MQVTANSVNEPYLNTVKMLVLVPKLAQSSHELNAGHVKGALSPENQIGCSFIEFLSSSFFDMIKTLHLSPAPYWSVVIFP